MTDEYDIQAEIATRLTEYIADKINSHVPYCGLRWSPKMPDDGTCDELLVIDSDGVEYELEIDATLWPRRPPPRRPVIPPNMTTMEVKDERL